MAWWHKYNDYQNREDGPEFFDPGPRVDRRCTPEILKAWLVEFRNEHKREPTLQDVKDRFGGILGPLMDYHDIREGKA